MQLVEGILNSLKFCFPNSCLEMFESMTLSGTVPLSGFIYIHNLKSEDLKKVCYGDQNVCIYKTNICLDIANELKFGT